MYGAALYRLRKEDFGELQHHDGISPGLADLLRRARALLHARGAALPRPRRARRGPDRASVERAVPASRRLARAADPAARRRPRGRRLPAVPRAVRDHARRVEPAVLDLHPLCDLRRLPVSRPREVRRRGARRSARARAFERHAADEREGRQARHERRGHGRHRGRRRSGRAGRSDSRRDVVVVACGAANTAKLLLESANEKHPNGLANGSDQVGRNYMFHDSTAVLALSREENHDRVPEDARAQRLLLRLGRLRVPARERPDGRQVDGADVPRRAAAGHEARARVDAGADGAPRDRLLALDRGPPAARQPGHGRRRREAHAHLHGDERGGQEAAVREGQVDCSGSST